MIIYDIFPQKSFWQSDDLNLSVHLSDYNSYDYTLVYSFAKNGVAPFSISSTPGSSNEFIFSVAASVTTDYIPGIYTVAASLVNGAGKKQTIGVSEIEIFPDVTKLENGDPRSINRKALDDVEAALASGAGSDIQEYTVAGTTMKKNRAGLLALRAYYLGQVRTENGIPAIGQIKYYL